jgi:DNA-directed RNA polymerase III subunit RPC1
VPTIQRAVINIKEKDDAKGKKGDKELLVEGYGLQKVMTTEGRLFYFLNQSRLLT